eukprot:scaffold22614_cov94-Isochrysis_galbana.AAC.3
MAADCRARCSGSPATGRELPSAAGIRTSCSGGGGTAREPRTHAARHPSPGRRLRWHHRALGVLDSGRLPRAPQQLARLRSLFFHLPSSSIQRHPAFTCRYDMPCPGED